MSDQRWATVPIPYISDLRILHEMLMHTLQAGLEHVAKEEPRLTALTRQGFVGLHDQKMRLAQDKAKLDALKRLLEWTNTLARTATQTPHLGTPAAPTRRKRKG